MTVHVKRVGCCEVPCRMWASQDRAPAFTDNRTGGEKLSSCQKWEDVHEMPANLITVGMLDDIRNVCLSCGERDVDTLLSALISVIVLKFSNNMLPGTFL